MKPIDKEFNAESTTQRIDPTFLGELISTHSKRIAPKYRKYQRLRRLRLALIRTVRGIFKRI